MKTPNPQSNSSRPWANFLLRKACGLLSLPLLAAMADGPAGKLPKSRAGLSLSRAGTLVTAFGENPDGGGTLLRVWEQSGAGGSLTVTLPAGFKATEAQPVNLRGEKTGLPIPLRNGKLTFALGGYAPASFILP